MRQPNSTQQKRNTNKTMKQTTKAGLLGASVTLAAALFVASLLPHEVKADGLGGGEKYKIVNVRGWDDEQLEQQLNKLGADGWKVRTVYGAVVIMAK